MISVWLLFCDRAICNIATNRGEFTLPDFKSKHVNLLFRKYYSFNKIYQTIARVSQNDFCKDSIILKGSITATWYKIFGTSWAVWIRHC